MTPLGRDAIRCVLSGAARLFGTTVEPSTNPYLKAAGERLWIRLDVALRNPVGRHVVPTVLRFIDPSAGAIVQTLEAEPFLAPQPRRTAGHTVIALARFARRVLPRVPLTLARPEQARDRFDAAVAGLIDDAVRSQGRAGAEPDPLRRAAGRCRALVDTLAVAFPILGPRVGPMIVPSIAGLRLLTRLVGGGDPASSPAGSRRLGAGHGDDPRDPSERDHRDGPGAMGGGCGRPLRS